MQARAEAGFKEAAWGRRRPSHLISIRPRSTQASCELPEYLARILQEFRIRGLCYLPILLVVGVYLRGHVGSLVLDRHLSTWLCLPTTPAPSLMPSGGKDTVWLCKVKPAQHSQLSLGSKQDKQNMVPQWSAWLLLAEILGAGNA